MTTPTLAHALLGLAVLVLVPAASRLHPSATRGAPRLLVAAAAPAAVSLLLPRGLPATLLALPWLVLAVVLAAATLPTLGRDRLHALPTSVAAGYLAVGAGWLVADRAGVAPLGFGDPFTVLTAVHFHVAGAVTTSIAAAWWRRRPSRPRLVALGLVMAGPPVVGAGFVAADSLLVLGAAMLTVGLWTWAGTVLMRGSGAGRWLRLAALAVLVPMLLALQWALGATLGWPALSIPMMERTHGVVNALLFALPAVLGLAPARAPDGDASRLRAGVGS